MDSGGILSESLQKCEERSDSINGLIHDDLQGNNQG